MYKVRGGKDTRKNLSCKTIHYTSFLIFVTMVADIVIALSDCR